MELFRSLQTTPVVTTPCIFTFGTFDGVHLGHQYIFNKVKEEARRLQANTACLTFSNHPAEVLTPSKTLAALTCDAQKVALIQSMGFDILIDLPFDAALRELSAEKFLQAVTQMLPIKELVVGSDVKFGKGGLGNKNFIMKYEPHMAAIFVERFCIDGLPVSSSRVRSAIQQADFGEAEKLLGRPYALLVKRLHDLCFDIKGLAVPPPGRYQARVMLEGEGEYRNAEILISSILEIYGIEYTGDITCAEVRILRRII
jgi:riboflavin kinase / FMN adenylyltransferase